jgi:hypothetical protein
MSGGEGRVVRTMIAKEEQKATVELRTYMVLRAPITLAIIIMTMRLMSKRDFIVTNCSKRFRTVGWIVVRGWS